MSLAFDPEIETKIHEHIKCELIELRRPDTNERLVSMLGIRQSEIEIYKTPIQNGRLRPGITIHPLKEIAGRGTCNSDDIGFGVAITFVQGTGRGDRDLSKTSLFRRMITGRFLHKPLVLEGCVWQVTAEYGAWMAPRELRQHYDYSSVALRCWTEQLRI